MRIGITLDTFHINETFPHFFKELNNGVLSLRPAVFSSAHHQAQEVRNSNSTPMPSSVLVYETLHRKYPKRPSEAYSILIHLCEFCKTTDRVISGIHEILLSGRNTSNYSEGTVCLSNAYLPSTDGVLVRR